MNEVCVAGPGVGRDGRSKLVELGWKRGESYRACQLYCGGHLVVV